MGAVVARHCLRTIVAISDQAQLLRERQRSYRTFVRLRFRVWNLTGTRRLRSRRLCREAEDVEAVLQRVRSRTL
jgi:hypothetical protein